MDSLAALIFSCTAFNALVPFFKRAKVFPVHFCGRNGAMEFFSDACVEEVSFAASFRISRLIRTNFRFFNH